MVDAPSGGAPKQAPRWDLMRTEGCGGGIRFLAPYLIVWGYVDIYRRKKMARVCVEDIDLRVTRQEGPGYS